MHDIDDTSSGCGSSLPPINILLASLSVTVLIFFKKTKYNVER